MTEVALYQAAGNRFALVEKPLLDYVRRAMPFQTPGSLSNDELYAVTAYVLFLNGIVTREQMIDADALARIRMPNRENFLPAHKPD